MGSIYLNDSSGGAPAIVCMTRLCRWYEVRTGNTLPWFCGWTGTLISKAPWSEHFNLLEGLGLEELSLMLKKYPAF